MKIEEIISSSEENLRGDLWKQTKKAHEALRKLRSKQQNVTDARASAAALPPGPERRRRLASTARRDADARRQYGVELAAANAARAKVLKQPS